MKIEVVDYSSVWNDLFEQEAALIQENTRNKESILSILHVGSTSVPGLKAKPIIDMLMIVKDVKILDEERDTFEALGYEYMGEYGLPGRRYMRKGGDHRIHHIHAYQYDNTNEILRHIAFRNYLRRHEETARDYESLKTKLASLYPNDRKAYSKGKDAFVEEVEKQALIEYWKQEH